MRLRYVRSRLRLLAVEPWSRGAVEPWSRGAVEPWSRGAVEPWSRGAVEPWSRGAVEFICGRSLTTVRGEIGM
jgi:hypothetical protein